jgi:hypothetical protein
MLFDRKAAIIIYGAGPSKNSIEMGVDRETETTTVLDLSDPDNLFNWLNIRTYEEEEVFTGLAEVLTKEQHPIETIKVKAGDETLKFNLYEKSDKFVLKTDFGNLPVYYSPFDPPGNKNYYFPVTPNTGKSFIQPLQESELTPVE